MRLAGKVTLITGAATGIGAAIARRFGQEGARVVVADINENEGPRTAAAVDGLFVRCDTGQPDQAADAVAQTVAAFGGLDILINAAAHLGGNHDAAEMTTEEWRAVLGVTLDGVFYCSKYAVQAMLQRGGGAIVNIASVEGMMGASSHAAYVTGKSALFGLTRSMAIDFGTRGIRVNAISPGIIDSNRPDIQRFKQDPTVMQFWRDMTVLDRMGQPEEIAAAALFLASDEASYITGQNLAVDGGWTIGHMPLRWPEQDASTMSLRFAQITDHHLLAGDRLLCGYSTTWALRSVLRHMAQNAGQLDFVVSTGDLVEGGTDDEYQAFLALLGARPAAAAPGPLLIAAEGLRDMPLYVLPGNHDPRPAFFRNLFPITVPADLMNVAFERGGVRFICLDWGPQGQAVASPVLLNHLASALNDELPTVLLMHHHIVPLGSRWLDALLAVDLTRFADMIAGRNILGIFAGHAHTTYESHLAGIPVYGLRSTCFQFVLQDDLLRCLLPPHYRIVTIDGGALTTEIVEVPL